jgi:hypothetical protein
MQSWYRDKVLEQPPGEMPLPGGGSRLVTNWLPREAVERDPSLNFLRDPRIERSARARLGQRGWGGIVQRDRLYRNMLSSQPLCFNLFVPLSDNPDLMCQLLNELLGVDAAHVSSVHIEWAPRIDGWKGGSAFDCFIEYSRSSGGNGFLGIECKYAENLKDQKPTSFDRNPQYREVTERPKSWFALGSSEPLNSRATCQLWYNACLAMAYEEASSPTYGQTAIVMTRCRQDEGAAAAVEALRAHCKRPEENIRELCYEDVVEFCLRSGMGTWSRNFERRYLSFAQVKA